MAVGSGSNFETEASNASRTLFFFFCFPRSASLTMRPSQRERVGFPKVGEDAVERLGLFA